MSAGASVSALQRLVEQLKLEAGVERIKAAGTGTSQGWWKCWPQRLTDLSGRNLEEQACNLWFRFHPWHLTTKDSESRKQMEVDSEGLSGSGGAPAVLHAECLQGCPAARRASWEQSLPGAPVLCFTLKTGRSSGKHMGKDDRPGPKKTVSTAKFQSLLPGPRAKLYRNPFL